MKDHTFKSVLFVLLFSVLMIVAAAIPLHAQSQTLYLPTLATSDTLDMGVALLNPSTTVAEVVLTARGYDGAVLYGTLINNPVKLTLPPSSQKALRVTEAFGPGMASRTGWVEISTLSPDVRGFFVVYDNALTFIDGMELPAAPSSRLIFPRVTSSPAPSQLTLVNTRSHAIGAIVSLYRNNGSLLGTWPVSLPALSGFAGTINQLIDTNVSFEGYVVVDSALDPASATEALVGFETYRYRSDIAMVRGFPESARLRTGYLAHFANQGGYASTLTLVNSSDQTQVLKITAETSTPDGNARTVTVERTLQPYARLEERVDRMFFLTDPTFIGGYIRFETQTDTPGVIGFLDYSSTDGVILSAVEAQGAGYSDFFFEHVAEGGSFYTGMALVNPNSEPSTVTLDSFDSAANRTNSIVVSLKPGERKARLLSEFFQRNVNQMGGYIHVTATKPIIALQLFGSRTSATFLANVAVRGVRLKPKTNGRVVDFAEGANVLSTDGSVSILIPPRALNSSQPISLRPVSVTAFPKPFPNQKAVSGVEALPAGTQLQIPSRLSFSLNVQVAPGTQLPLLIFDPQTQRYTQSGFVATVGESGRMASAEVTHFTVFVVALPDDQLLAVSSLSPLQGQAGTIVTITGSGFSSVASDNVVTFAGANNTSVPGTVFDSTPTVLHVQTPVGAVTGPVVVRIGAQTSTGLTFSVPAMTNPTPTDVSLAPSIAQEASGPIDVAISGTGFLEVSFVQYDGATVPSRYIDSTLMMITLFNQHLTAGFHRVQVVNPLPGGGASNAVDFVATTDAPPGPNPAPPSNPGPTPTPTNQAPMVSAGPDQTVTLPTTANVRGSVFDDGLPAGASLTTTWSKVSGPGTVTFGNVNAPSTTAGFSSAGAYVLRLMASDGAVSTSDDAMVTVNAASVSNQAPVVNAGASQTITLPASANLNGTASDDGMPTGSTLTRTWSKVSGPGTVTFGNANALTTTATFSVAGSYVLALTGSDGAASSADNVSITVNPVPPANQAPTVNAGSDQTITLPATASLSGAASDDGLPAGSTLTRTWSKVSGPGTVTFGNANAQATTAAFSAAGSYVLALTASDGTASSTDNVSITVNPTAPGNQPPTVNAGPDQTITLPATASLSGTVSDDGLPTGSILTRTWTKVSGPGTVTFGNANVQTTIAAFSTAGSYVLALTGSDGAASNTDNISITVNSAAPINQVPTVNAGPDQTITLPATASLSGTVSDDGLPTGSTLTRTWSKVSGPGTVTFGNANAQTTTAAFSAAGTYVLGLTGSDGASSSFDNVSITVNGAAPVNQAPTVNAGANQTITLPASANLSGTASDDGLPVGSTLTRTWSKVSGPGTVTFGNASAQATTASFSVAGSYVLRLTASDGVLASMANVTITVNAGSVVPPPPPPPSGQSFYVSPSGNDSNNGSLASPWRTIQKALMSTGPGATVYMRAGTYSESIEMRGDPGNRFGKTMGGSPAGWWTLSGYPGETATMSGSGFDAYSVQYTRFQNLNWINGANLGVGTADWVGGVRSHHVEILNNTFSGTQVRYGFMEVKFDNSLVEGNIITITGSGGNTMDHGIYLHNGDGNTLRGNIVSGATGYNIHVYDERKGSSDPQTFYTNVIVENNILFNSVSRSGLIVSQGGDTVVNGVIVRNNITWGSDSGIDLTNYGGQNMNGIKVYNNTILDGIEINNTKIQSSEIRNNIILGGITGLSAGVTASNNLMTGDPMFVNAAAGDYHLQSSSPAINQGMTLSSVPTDKDGAARPVGGAYDLGAYEFGGTPAAPSAAPPAPAPPAPTPDTTAPTVSLTAPASAATVSGASVAVSANASDNTGVVGVQFKLNGSNLGAEDTTSPYSVNWNTTTSANGSHNLTAVASDAAGNQTTSLQVSVTVNNVVAPPDGTAPTVTLSAPAAGSTVAGASVAVSANASDNVAVVGVQFKLDGANLGAEDTTSPYSVIWNTTASTNAAHNLTAVARDAAGNQTTSLAVSVTVNNVVVPPPPASAETFYVSPSGNDSNNGSLASPWRTIQKALMSTGPGATVYLRAGSYSENIEMRGDPGNRFGKTMGGSPAGWWTLSGYPGETASIAGGNFSAYSIQYTRFQNLNFINSQNLGVGTADWVSPSGARSHHVEVLNNTFSGAQPRYGFVEVKFDNSLVEGNIITIIGGGGNTMDHGIYLHNGDSNTLRGNVISGATGYNIHVYDERKGSSDPQTFYSNVVIENNILFNSGSRSGLIVSQGGDTVVQSVIIRNNITWGSDSGIDLTNYGGQNMNGIKVYNNTILDGIEINNAKIQGSEIRNNIILGGITGVSVPGVTTSNNFLTGDPMFVDAAGGDYHLRSGSPAINQGVTLSVVPTDKDGVARPVGGAYDLGAYEYQP